MAKKTELTAATFDYNTLEKDETGKLIRLAGEINKRAGSLATEIMAVGESLKSAQDVLANYSNGTFVKWVETELPFSSRTAYNYIEAYSSFGSFATVAKLEPSAMYKLASPKVPESARKEAVKTAEKGQAVTGKIAAEIIKKHSPNGKSSTSAKTKKTKASADSSVKTGEPVDIHDKPDSAEIIGILKSWLDSGVTGRKIIESLKAVCNASQWTSIRLFVEDQPDKKKGGRGFTPPTIVEVQAYCLERENDIDGEQFVNFYESKGWMIGKNKMKDWKAAVRTWENKSKQERKKLTEDKQGMKFKGTATPL